MLRAMIAVFLIVVSVAVAPLRGASSEIENALVVASYNIRYGTAADGDNAWVNRRDLCMEVIRNLDADIIGLQEVLAFQLEELRDALPHYTVVGVGRDDGVTKGEYAPLLIRTDRFTIDQSSTMWLSDTPMEPGSSSWGNTIPRICTWVRLVDRATNSPVWVYNMHLDHRSQESRTRSIEFIASQIAARREPVEPVVVMGDLNAGETNPVVQYAIGTTQSASGNVHATVSPHLTDTFRAIFPDATEVGTFSGFKDQRNGAKIDHVFCSAAFKVLDAGIDRTRGEGGRCPSDHEAVWAKLAHEAESSSE